MLDTWMTLAFEKAGPVAAGVVLAVFVVVVVIGVVAKTLGFTGLVDKQKLVDNGKVDAVSGGVEDLKEKLGDIDKRLGAVEQDLQNRPTKDDHHRLELSFTRLEGEVRSLAMTVQATANGVSRIEDYMYSASVARRNGGGAG